MILALDTSLHDLRIGLFTDDAKELASFHHAPTPHERGVHDAMLAEKTAELLAKISATAKNITRIVIVAGPGSFTGLRIGYAFAKGIAYATGAAIMPIPSHTALRQTYIKEAKTDSGVIYIYPGYDKRSLYLANASNIDEIVLMAVTDLDFPADTIFAGPPAAFEILPAKFTRRTVCEINLTAIAELASRLPQVKNSEELAGIEPLYITPFTPHPASRKPT